ncbi:antirestriction protein ArdA [Caminibacter sp.]
MKIYIQDLQKYNQGCSVCGQWIDLKEFDEDELQKIMKNLVKEEFILLDWEFEDNEEVFFTDLINEYANPIDLLYRQQTIDDLEENEKDALVFLLEYGNFDFNEAINKIYDVTFEYGDMQEVAERFLEEQMGKEVYDKIYPYINFQKYIKDLEIEGFVEYNNKTFYPF